MNVVASISEHDAELEELWQLNNKPGWNRRALFLPRYSSTETFVQRHWRELNADERHCVITHCKLSMEFLRDHWNEFTVTEQKTGYARQELTMEFIKSIWATLHTSSVSVVARCQNLTPEFIIEYWNEMSWLVRCACLDYQERFPAKLIIEHQDDLRGSSYWNNIIQRKRYDCSGITLEELPEYLSCEVDGIRLSAEERLRELGGDRE